MVSSSELTEGETYTISAGGTDTEITVDGISVKEGESSFGGGMGGGSGRQMQEGEAPSGEAPSGEAPQMQDGERPELPEGVEEGDLPEMPNGEKPSGNPPSGNASQNKTNN